jgi:hypothetical protein
MNSLLSEILFNIRTSRDEYNHLHNLISDLKALSANASSTSLQNSRNGSLSSYFQWNNFAVVQPLLSFDIVVYRPVRPPASPVMNAPDLKGVFRIFYTSSTLYNHKNPEITAKSSSRLASTTQVSLPIELKYKFWTVNMRDHKQTLPQDISIDEIVSNIRKNDPGAKKMRIVLKVE